VCPAPPKAPFIPAPKIAENGRPKPALAMRQCAKLKGTPAFNECIFDVSILGDAGIPAAFARSVLAKQKQ
jgi:hypothetical protein